MARDVCALRITLTGSASDPQFSVEQFLPVEHDNTGDHDDSETLFLIDQDGSVGIKLDVSVTDKDEDSDSDSHYVELIDHNDSILIRQEGSGEVAGAYVDAGWQISPRVSLRGGMRSDLFTTDPEPRFAPRLSATFMLSDRANVTFQSCSVMIDPSGRITGVWVTP